MTVSELKKLLDQHPDDMEVIVDRYSDYDPVETVEVISAVRQHNYIMDTHPTMSRANQERIEQFLYLSWQP